MASLRLVIRIDAVAAVIPVSVGGDPGRLCPDRRGREATVLCRRAEVRRFTSILKVPLVFTMGQKRTPTLDAGLRRGAAQRGRIAS